MNRQKTHISNRVPSWTPSNKTDEQLIQVIWDLRGDQGGSRRRIGGMSVWGKGSKKGLGVWEGAKGFTRGLGPGRELGSRKHLEVSEGVGGL